MEGLFVGLMIFATVLAIIGLVLVFLQKKGKVSSFTTMTASGPNYVSVGKDEGEEVPWKGFAGCSGKMGGSGRLRTDISAYLRPYKI